MAYIGKQPVVGNFVKLDAIVTSATATYNLLNGGVAYFPQTANNCIVSLNGVIQSPTSAYTISGSTIVFDSALTALDTIDFILVLGDVLNIGTPSDATVSFSKVTSNLITGATAETSIAGGDSVLIYDDSASALRKMTRTNFVSGIGGTNTPAFEAYTTGFQTVSNNVLTKLTIATEVFDSDSNYDNATNYRFTPTTAGKYFVYARAMTDPSAYENERNSNLQFYKNGSAVGYTLSDIMVGGNGSGGATATVHNIEHIIEFNGSSDYIEVFGLLRTMNGTGVTIGYKVFGAYKLIGA
jgi:hypothetical protein